MNLGRLKNIELRTVWKHETTDFTNWLSNIENLKLLNNEVGMSLYVIKREALAGRFRADILAKDSLSNEIVIIENQLENTNHSHLGQLITYSSHYDAKSIIWIVKELRIEHEKAIEWLNKNLSNTIKIFLVKVELFVIGDSIPAPKFTILSKPYGWTNALFRKEVDIEPFPKSLIDHDKLRKSIINQNLIDFLNKTVVIDFRYVKKELLDMYSKMHTLDSQYYRKHANQFRKDLNTWAILNGLIINKDYQNEKQKGYHKSAGMEFITFNNS